MKVALLNQQGWYVLDIEVSIDAAFKAYHNNLLGKKAVLMAEDGYCYIAAPNHTISINDDKMTFRYSERVKTIDLIDSLLNKDNID